MSRHGASGWVVASRVGGNRMHCFSHDRPAQPKLDIQNVSSRKRHTYQSALTAARRSDHNRRNSAMALAGFKVIDADGHVTEPATLYKTHIDPKFRAGSDDLLSRLGAGKLGIVPALYPKWRSAERPLGDADEVPGLGKFPSGRNHPLASPAGGYDPAERIRDMDKEGIDVAVCFATVATSVCAASDPAMEAALARAYNRWVGEYCAAFPSRIKAVGIVPQRAMDLCAAEVAYLAREPWAIGIMTFGN